MKINWVHNNNPMFETSRVSAFYLKEKNILLECLASGNFTKIDSWSFAIAQEENKNLQPQTIKFTSKNFSSKEECLAIAEKTLEAFIESGILK